MHALFYGNYPIYTNISPIAYAERMGFMEVLDPNSGPRHEIDRSKVYEAVLSLYSKNAGVCLEYPFCIEFKGEMAFDVGGVARDMFSAFFSQAYVKLFDGSCLLFPAVHASIDMTTFSTLGTIISHCYLVSGMFPDRIAFPCLAAALLGPNSKFPDLLLEKYFFCCLSTHEASTVRGAIQLLDSKFEPSLQTQLASIFGWYGCRALPQPSNLKQLILQASRYTFLVKPAAPIAMIHSGIPKEHQPFWAHMTVSRFHNIYSTLSVSVLKVLDLLHEPVIENEGQECAWSYLRRFIGNMTIEELRSFLRFVTGSFVISVDSITVTFNTSDGFGRRPTAHTCSSMLEIPTTYSSLPEFVSEFQAILSDPSYAWTMDSV